VLGRRKGGLQVECTEYVCSVWNMTDRVNTVHRDIRGVARLLNVDLYLYLGFEALLIRKPALYDTPPLGVQVPEYYEACRSSSTSPHTFCS
jgi:hypothetical protein